MRAMVLDQPRRPLRAAELPIPSPGPGQVLVRVAACGLCRTDLHVVDGELDRPRLPLVPGHQVVGRIARNGEGTADLLPPGTRVGVPWLGGSCGCCRFCADGRENLCESAVYTGYQRDGGFAEYCLADARYAFPLPDGYDDLQVAPLLCAGLIGYRAWRLTLAALPERGGPDSDSDRGLGVGFFGFGAAAHILCQVARHAGHRVHAFVKPGDARAAAFALSLGAAAALAADRPPPRPLDAAIIFAPVGELVPAALRAVDRGGVVTCAGIHMSDIPTFPYADLWHERRLQSVANLTRRDAVEFLALAPRIPVRTTVHPYPLARADEALADLRLGRFEGAAVLIP
ncbi:zinc-binding alcohol dehydrogenase family protein [bacterium]|nr:zinc-binding alcohol dehydrogenase family protein [bacterium]